jgi:E3 ubiquitin-protein ligase RNF213
LTPEKILVYINYEQNDYILRMELEEGIAVNLALKENIFAVIPCIMNKIPIFICGKPGCSKSMAISLIFENLKGEKSKDPFFQKLNNLIMVSF